MKDKPLPINSGAAYADIAIVIGKHIQKGMTFNEVYKEFNKVYRDLYKDKEN